MILQLLQFFDVGLPKLRPCFATDNGMYCMQNSKDYAILSTK